MESRIYGKEQKINTEEIKELYAGRAEKSKTVHVDAPTVLSGDRNPENIELWTQWELEKWFPRFELDENSVVLELGFGTGRMTKYLIPFCKRYIGIDYVKEFADIVQEREDIEHKERAMFISDSFDAFLEKAEGLELPKITHFFLSGGVFMYMNDDVVQQCIVAMEALLDKKCKIYISEPIAMQTRLTLNSFYSEQIEHVYSAIYRTEDEYRRLFQPLLEKGFLLEISEPFFEKDIKNQKETQQWIFILERE